MKKVCVVGVSGKLGQYMLQHALDRSYEVVGVCRESSVEKLEKCNVIKHPNTQVEFYLIKLNIVLQSSNSLDTNIQVPFPFG